MTPIIGWQRSEILSFTVMWLVNFLIPLAYFTLQNTYTHKGGEKKKTKTDFLFHFALVAGLWGLLALHLADDPILPFNYLSYAEQLQVCVSFLNFI